MLGMYEPTGGDLLRDVFVGHERSCQQPWR